MNINLYGTPSIMKTAYEGENMECIHKSDEETSLEKKKLTWKRRNGILVRLVLRT
jgi:hypothetical protein